jgi:hypothetical protein
MVNDIWVCEVSLRSILQLDIPSLERYMTVLCLEATLADRRNFELLVLNSHRSKIGIFCHIHPATFLPPRSSRE